MNSMNDIFLKLKKDYNNFDITFDKNYNFINIKKDDIKIDCDDNIIKLYIKNKEITHYHFENENFKDIYEKIIYYINNYNKISKFKIIINITVVISAIIIGIILKLMINGR